MGTVEQINEFGELLEDIDGDFAQLDLGPGLVELAADIEDLTEEYPKTDANEEALAYASFFRGYGEDMEAAIGNSSEYVDVMQEMMEDESPEELNVDFVIACRATLAE